MPAPSPGDGDGLPWSKIAYGLTAAWMIGIVGVTGGDVTHPLFDYIFLVPLAGWVMGLIVQKILEKRRRD
jgi:hypothetical protein